MPNVGRILLTLIYHEKPGTEVVMEERIREMGVHLAIIKHSLMSVTRCNSPFFFIPVHIKNEGFPGVWDNKESTCNAETWVWSLGWKDPLEEGMATHYSILAWRIPWREEPGRLQSMGLPRVTTGWLALYKKLKHPQGSLSYFYTYLNEW